MKILVINGPNINRLGIREPDIYGKATYSDLCAKISAHCEKNGIENAYDYLKPFVEDYNKNAVPYKKIGVLKVRDEEFPKNTLRKIQRSKLDMSID